MGERPTDGVTGPHGTHAGARRLAALREATLSGDGTPEPRAVIDASWRRVRGCGVDPDHDRRERPLNVAELEHRPYRFADGIVPELRLPPDPGQLLPHSVAPGVRAARGAEGGVG
ncbi:hypothetical protein OG422_24845 [Streptomyces sp. NBC_01525]|uniref:hypothetical protein n=1 Tax=Streptomyces sp. NBC_01525 TaxID=2903893 RepID=UPI00386FC95B